MISSAIDLKKLRAFYFVAKHGNLRNAAARLLLSTSAISIQINQLERDLGVKLFGRIGRKLVLEPAGEIFLEQVHGVFAKVEDAVASISKAKLPTKRISVAVGTDLTRVFSAAIGRFMKNHPDVGISLQLKHAPDSVARILEGELDMAVGYYRAIPKDLASRCLMKSGFSMAFSKSLPLAKIAAPTIRDLAGYHVIALKQQTDMGHRILRAFEEAGVELPNYFETGNCQSSRELAAQGIGISVAHTTCVSDYQAPPGMRVIDATDLLGTTDIAVIYGKSHTLSPLHEELLAEMVSVATAHAKPRRARKA